MYRNMSVEYLSPSFASPRRQSTLWSCVFSLVSTIVGGGALSLPLMVHDTGVVLGLALLVVMAVASALSLDLLIACSRRHHRAITYEAVAKAAFGPLGHALSLSLLFVLLFLAIIAYLILVRDLLPPCIEFLLGSSLSDTSKRVAMIVAMIALFPLCLARSLNALSFTSVLSVVSMIALAGVIAVRGYHSTRCTASELFGQFLWPTSLASLLTSSGLAVCSYCCVFNTLSVHSSLILPTRARVRWMLHFVMLCCGCIYVAIALGGLCWAGDLVEGNILLNFDADDELATIGRVGLLLTVLFSLPLLVLPCRDVCEKIVHAIQYGDSELDEDDAVTEAELDASPEPGDGDDEPKSADASTPLLQPSSFSRFHRRVQSSLPSTFPLTAAIVLVSMFFSLMIPSVATVWSLLGGSVSVLLSFTMPCACYLRIRRHKPFGPRHITSLTIVVTSVLFILANTTAQLSSLFTGG